jgi:hypothetical protein
MINSTEFAGGDDLFCQRHRRNSSVVVPDHRADTRFLHGVDQTSPIRVVRLVAPFVSKLLYLFRIPRRNRLEHGVTFKIEKLADGQVSIRMRARFGSAFPGQRRRVRIHLGPKISQDNQLLELTCILESDSRFCRRFGTEDLVFC